MPQPHVPTVPAQEQLGVQTVDYEVVESSPSESLSPASTSAVATFKVHWGDRVRFIRECLGFSYLNGGLRRWLPQPYPDYITTGLARYLFATRVIECKGVGEFGTDMTRLLYSWPEYRFAYVTIQFEALLYDIKFYTEIEGQEWRRYVIRTEEPMTRLLTTEKGQWVYPAAAPVPIGGNPVGRGEIFKESRIKLRWLWLDVPNGAYNPERLRLSHEKVNQFLFDGYAPETLKLESTLVIPTTSAVGGRTNNIQIIFEYFGPKPGIGHNHILAIDNNYYKVETQVGGNPIHESMNFAELFQP